MTATATTTYQLRAVTDDSIGKVHLGAAEKGNVAFCGVRLLVENDPRFGGRYKGIVFTTSPDLTTVTCGACKRSAAWKGQQDGRYTTPAPKAPTPRKRTSQAARNAAKNAAREAAAAVSGSSVIEPDPETGLPRIKPEVQAKADKAAAAQKARNAVEGEQLGWRRVPRCPRCPPPRAAGEPPAGTRWRRGSRSSCGVA